MDHIRKIPSALANDCDASIAIGSFDDVASQASRRCPKAWMTVRRILPTYRIVSAEKCLLDEVWNSETSIVILEDTALIEKRLLDIRRDATECRSAASVSQALTEAGEGFNGRCPNRRHSGEVKQDLTVANQSLCQLQKVFAQFFFQLIFKNLTFLELNMRDSGVS
jgi:hypothetical protein